MLNHKEKYKYFWPKNNSCNMIDPLRTYIFRPWDLFRDIKNTIKYSRQRAKYGFAICDTWNIDLWITGTLPYMLRDLAYNTHSTPYYFSQKEWADKLCEIADLLDQNKDEFYNIDDIKKGLKMLGEYFHELWD